MHEVESRHADRGSGRISEDRLEGGADVVEFSRPAVHAIQHIAERASQLLEQALQTTTIQPPRVPLVSTVTNVR